MQNTRTVTAGARTQTWYSKNSSGGQGIVIDEATGRNVAVAYDEADAPLLAAAPEMLAALRKIETLAEADVPNAHIDGHLSVMWNLASDAIQKATSAE